MPKKAKWKIFEVPEFNETGDINDAVDSFKSWTAYAASDDVLKDEEEFMRAEGCILSDQNHGWMKDGVVVMSGEGFERCRALHSHCLSFSLLRALGKRLENAQPEAIFDAYLAFMAGARNTEYRAYKLRGEDVGPKNAEQDRAELLAEAIREWKSNFNTEPSPKDLFDPFNKLAEQRGIKKFDAVSTFANFVGRQQ